MEYASFEKFVVFFAIVAGSYAVYLVAKWAIDKFYADANERYIIKKRSSLYLFVLIIMAALSLWAESFRSLFTMVGLLSAGLTLALKDPLSSIVAWFVITGGKIYNIGDRIELAGTKGDVIDISLLTTTLIEVENWVGGEQSTGRLTRVPNNWVFGHSVFNYTKAFHISGQRFQLQ